MQNDLQTWWQSLPFVTKYLFAGSMLVTLVANFGLVHYVYLLLDFGAILKQFQLWRLITAFLFHGRLGFPFLMRMVFLLQYGKMLEQGTFFNRTADYIFMLAFGAVALLLPAFILDMKILGMSMIMMIIAYWARKNPALDVRFMFGLQFKAAYLPWVMLAFEILLGGWPLSEFLGMGAAHLYFYLTDIYPNISGRRWLQTPQFLLDLFPNQQAAPQHNPAAPRARGYNWGQGNVLGQ
jgi:hypothetical protein